MRAAERQLAKAYVLLCQPDGGDDGEHVAVWLYCSGNERRHTAEQGRIGLLGGPPEQEEVAVVTLALPAEVILAQ